MKRRKTVNTLMMSTVCGVMLCLSAMWIVAGETPEYVGAKKCQFCHKDEHKHWETTKHAKALDVLKPEERKDACLKCHNTGHGKAAAAGAELDNVQCEACHGPGSLYKKTMIKKAAWKEDPEGQRKAAQEVGLVLPGKEVCVTCHNEESPTFKGFDFDARIKEVKHKAEGGCE